MANPAEKQSRSSDRTGAGADGPAATLRGVPQHGIALGSADAPVTMVEFADLQCPFCREYHEQVFPALLERYVETGKVRLELRLLRFIGRDSDRLARTAASAGVQNRMWQVAGLAYARQGSENSGYADDAFLRELIADAGLDAVDADTGETVVAAAEREAHHAGIESTPSFLVGPTGGKLERFEPNALAPESFFRRLEQALAQ
jgi:protein-disulfide isomerase